MNTYAPGVSQQLIWLDQLLTPQSAKYNIGGYAVLNGQLHEAAFRKAVNTVLQTQEAYVTLLDDQEGNLQCYVSDLAQQYCLPVIDFSGCAYALNEAKQWMEDDFAKPFDCRKQPLFYFCLLRINDNCHLWYAKIHHLIADGWSFKLLLDDTAALYTQYCQGTAPAAVTYLYSHFAREDAAYYASGEAAADREFWMQQYRQLPPALLTKQHTVTDGAVAGSETLHITKEEKQHLQQIADANKVSLFQLLIAALIVYFSRTRQQHSLAIGMPVLNRGKKVYRRTAGVFMNMLAVRYDIEENAGWASVLGMVKRQMMACLRHQRYQYGNLVKDLQLPLDKKILYDIRVSYEEFAFAAAFGDLQTQAVALSNVAEEDPLAMYIRDYHDEGFDIRFVYNRAYFNAGEVQQLCGRFHFLLGGLPDNDGPVHRLPLIPPAEQAAILHFSEGGKQLRGDGTFSNSWNKAVAIYGTRQALSGTGESLTYLQLQQRVQLLAAALLRAGLQPGQPVALLLPRNEWQVVAMLAVLQAGGCFVPLDADYPAERLEYMFADAGCRLVVCSAQTAHLPLVAAAIQVQADQRNGVAENTALPPVPVAPHSPAYMIYTSGSTGKPKGVTISQASLLDYACTFVDYFQLHCNDVVLQQASVSFDTAVEEIFPVLLSGGRLHILENRKNLEELAGVLHSQQVTVLSTNPMVIDYLNGLPVAPSLRILISGGDVFKPSQVSRLLLTGLAVYNTYGPTESTVCASYYRVTGKEQVLPIGRPITNRRLYVLDKHLQLTPLGAEGDLYIGGEGLALAYHNRPDLYKEKFIADPFESGRLLYHTGDRAVLDASGNFLFKGRSDRQLSLRGYRIEAFEVEAVIAEQPGVKECMVTITEQGGVPVLAAFISLQQGIRYTALQWRRWLKSVLPLYMIPEIWVQLDDFERLPNGKINTAALPAAVETSVPEGFTLPTTGTEQRLCQLWEEVLQRPVGITHSFFELGGHSLNAFQLLGKIREQLYGGLQLVHLLEKETIQEQAAFIDECLLLQPVQAKGPEWVLLPVYPLTHAQERLWVVTQLPDAAKAYHIAGALEVFEAPDQQVLLAAINTLLYRHEALRAVFVEAENGSLHQQIQPEEAIAAQDCYTFYPLSHTAGGWPQKAQDLEAWIAQPFSLEKGPLFRVVVVQTAPDAYLLLYVLHHIIADGWSMEVLLHHFMEACVAIRNNTMLEEAVADYGYSDYVYWLRNQEDNPAAAAALYWKEQFAAGVPVTALPVSSRRPAVKTYEGKELNLLLPAQGWQQVQQWCAANGYTPFMALLAALHALLYRYTGQTAAVTGTPIANRHEPALQQMVGLLLNMLPVVCTFDGNEPFTQWMSRHKATLLQAYQHSNYPMDVLLQQIRYQVPADRSPLFDVVLVLHNQSVTQVAAEFATGVPYRVYTGLPKKVSQFDMSFSFYYESNSLRLALEYNTTLFSDEFAHQFATHYITLLQQLVEHPYTAVNEISFLSVAEKAWLLPAPNALTTAESGHTLHRLQQSVAAYGNKPAVIYEEDVITYNGLWNRAAAVAAALQKQQVIPGDRVALLVTPNAWLPAAVLGIWLAGAIYVPVNEAYPEAWREAIIADAGCRVLINNGMLHTIAQEEGDKDYTPGNNAMAYIMYHPGVAGECKGVLVSHRALWHTLQNEISLLALRQPINALLVTPYSADVSLLELLLPLVTGGCIVVPQPQQLLQPSSLAQLMVAHQVNVLQGTPSLTESWLRGLAAEEALAVAAVLQVLCIGGEPLTQKLVQTLQQRMPGVTVNNHYSTRETTIDALVKTRVTDVDSNSIGIPLPGVRAYVLSREGLLLPPGAIGELCLAGPVLAEGYWQQPDKTAEKFVYIESAGERVYRTGDLVRWNRHREIEYIGSSHAQVTIRGQRVELEEIRRILETHEAVQLAHVCVYDEEAASIAAFVVPLAPEAAVTAYQLKHYLQQFLPAYMIPAFIVAVPGMPVNYQGKTDSAALRLLVNNSPAEKEVAAPATFTEQQLWQLWQSLLGVTTISTYDNFFDLGGNSIMLMRMRTDIKNTLGVQVPVTELFRHLTIVQLAQLIDSVRWLQAEATPVADEAEEFIV